MTDIDYDALALLLGCTHKFVYFEHERDNKAIAFYGYTPVSSMHNFESLCNVIDGVFAKETRYHTQSIGKTTPLE